MVARRHDRQSRQNHCAELPAPIDEPAFRITIAAIHIEIGAVHPVVLRKLCTQDGRGVDATGALPMALHFLQGDDVRVLDLAGDASEVVAVVFAEPVLDVVGDDLHESLTARAASDRFMSFSLALARVSSTMPQSGARISCPFGTKRRASLARSTRDSTLSTSFSPTSMTPSMTVFLPMALNIDTSRLLAAPSMETTFSRDSDSQLRISR